MTYLINSSRVIFWQGEAVKLIADGKAPRITQPEEGATYEAIMKKERAEVPTFGNYNYTHIAITLANKSKRFKYLQNS